MVIRLRLTTRKKKVILEGINDHVVEEGVEHEELGLQGFEFKLLDEER